MVIHKNASELKGIKEINPNVYKSKKSNVKMATDMASFKATFSVMRDEDGYLCAADMDQGIFTDGKDEEELMKNIHEAVECHFDVPHTQVSITIKKAPN